MRLTDLTPDAMATHLRGLGYQVTPPAGGGRQLLERRAEIIERVCEYTGVDPYTLRSGKRTARVNRSRRLAVYLLRSELAMTLVAVGRALHRDFSEVRTAWIQATEGPHAERFQTDAAKAMGSKQ